ncbi:peptidoglycan-binding domain-containing protein [Aureivirga sp. CE67]|uniref:peptidoglycan-binding domain-containing protein n=1 Tax=Aureivirga sp. CE67 TaxID=1788983 RepID=UPI0018CB3B19|nr:hypothetical protein [Aureivirga sp. CE67]
MSFKDHPSYDFLDSKDAISKVVSFDALVTDASDKGIISDLPSSDKETYDFKKQRLRIQTFASRLYLLGYLKEKIVFKGKESISDEIIETVKNAVHKFQIEAGLKQDNWVGEKTWNALDEIVSFESEMNEDFWFDGEEIRENRKYALHRAIQLRLWALGMHDHKPKLNFELLKESDLESFVSVQLVLHFRINAHELNKRTVSYIFDQDFLTHKIASRRGEENEQSFQFKDYDEVHKNRARKFIINTLKVELWLLGFEVDIDGAYDFEYKRGSKLFKALKSFYIKFQDKKKNRARKLAKRIIPNVFTEIDAINQNQVGFDEDDFCDDVVEEMNSSEKINTMWDSIKEKGTRLWDGVKRFWRAIKKIGKKIVRFFIDNIYKGFLRFATRTYHYLKNGFRAIVNSISNYVKGEIKFENCTYFFRKDMDAQIVISNNIENEQVNYIVGAFQYQSKAFNVGCKLVSFLIDVIKKLATGFLGWAKFLFSMVRSYKDVKQIVKDFHFLAVNPI